MTTDTVQNKNSGSSEKVLISSPHIIPNSVSPREISLISICRAVEQIFTHELAEEACFSSESIF